VAEAVARDMPHVPLEDALKLVHLYAEKESPKYENAAMKFLRRYLAEKEPTLRNLAEIVANLARQQPDASLVERVELGWGRLSSGSAR